MIDIRTNEMAQMELEEKGFAVQAFVEYVMDVRDSFDDEEGTSPFLGEMLENCVNYALNNSYSLDGIVWKLYDLTPACIGTKDIAAFCDDKKLTHIMLEEKRAFWNDYDNREEE